MRLITFEVTLAIAAARYISTLIVPGLPARTGPPWKHPSLCSTYTSNRHNSQHYCSHAFNQAGVQASSTMAEESSAPQPLSAAPAPQPRFWEAFYDTPIVSIEVDKGEQREVFKAPRALLIKSSPVFEAMLTGVYYGTPVWAPRCALVTR